ncbi:MAG: PE-PPE domain-containing protein [Mycobacterium sp.]
MIVAAVAFAATVAMGFMSSIGIGVKLLAGTLVLIGGNSNPTSAGMNQQLGGDPLPVGVKTSVLQPVGVAGQAYLDPTNPASPFYGYNPLFVQWPSQIPFTTNWNGGETFEQSQQAGLTAMQAAIASGLASGGPVEVAGYSSSANIVVQELKALKAEGSPDTSELQFMMLAGMNRPNGGIAERFAGIVVPFINVPLGGSPQTTTNYKVTDVSWQYDPISDFPNYPLDVVSDLNSLVAFFTQHSDYYYANVSPSAPRVTPDTTVGNITYITLAAPTLPLLLPLEALGFPKPFINLIEPALKVLVDFGYNRRISPGTPTPWSLAPTPDQWISLPFALIQAAGQGIADALNPNYGKTQAATTTSATPVAAVKPAVQQLKSLAATSVAAVPNVKPDNNKSPKVKQPKGDKDSSGQRHTQSGDQSGAGDQSAVNAPKHAKSNGAHGHGH